MSKNYDLEAMQEAKRKLESCVEGVKDNCRNLIAQVQGATDENDAKKVTALCDSFAEKVKKFTDVCDETVACVSKVVSMSEATDVANN